MNDLKTLYELILLIVLTIMILILWKKLSDNGLALPY